MESPKDTLMFQAKVLSVEEKWRRVWFRGLGKEAIFHSQSMGWFIALEGSHESLYAGENRPNVWPGLVATIRIDFHDPNP